MFLFLIGISVPEYQQHILRRYGEKYYRNSGKGRKSFRNKCGVRIVQRIVKHRFNSSIPLQCFASGSLASYNFLSSLKHRIYWDACKGNVLSRLFVLFENYFLLIKRSCKICLHFSHKTDVPKLLTKTDEVPYFHNAWSWTYRSSCPDHNVARVRDLLISFNFMTFSMTFSRYQWL